MAFLSAALARTFRRVACLFVALFLSACAEGPGEPPGTGVAGANNPPASPDLGPLLTADCAALGVREDDDGNGEACCGCLCASARWSCSEDTCTDSGGQVEELAAEAGYIEVPGGEYRTLGQAHLTPTQRVFYSFQPAGDSPEERPLAVFFNGGPGAATTAGLMALNTGPYTLDPERTGDADIAQNEHSFTRAYNLLYVDAPGTGFSYALPPEGGGTPVHTFDMDRDAGVVNRVLLFFLRHHAALESSKVILIGESYGATRAVQMARQLLDPESLLEEDGPYQDAELYCALQAHFASREQSDIDVTDIAAQFGHLALIQPWLLGSLQAQYSEFDSSSCAPDPAPYQCDEPLGFTETMDVELARRLLAPENLELILGTDPTTIAWLDPALRSPAYAVPNGESDVYVSLRSFDRTEGARSYEGTDTILEFMALLPYLKKVLITLAERDLTVDPYSLIRLIKETKLPTEEHADLPSGSARPGLVTLDLGGGVVGQLRMPHYETAGHMVTLRAPGEFFDDVVEWMGK